MIKFRRLLFAFGVFVGVFTLPSTAVGAQERFEDVTVSEDARRGEALLGPGSSDDDVPLIRLGVVLLGAGAVAAYGAQRRYGRRSAFSTA